LSDSNKRAVYDQYGEDGLKGQMPPPPDSHASGSGGSRNFSPDDFPYQFNHRTPDDIFAEFFGDRNPFGGMGGMGRGSNGMFGSYGDAGGSGVNVHQGPPRKASPIENKLLCSLEDIYKGTTKKMKITREILDHSG